MKNQKIDQEAAFNHSKGIQEEAVIEEMKEIKDTHYSKEERASSDLTFYACGSQNFSKGMSYGPIVRNYYVIHFVTGGSGVLYIRNQTFEVHKGQAFLLPAHIPHEYAANPEDPWQYCWVSFLGLRAPAYFQMLQNACENGFVTPEVNANWYLSQIETMISRFTPDWSGYFRTNALTAQILAELFSELHVEEKVETADDRMMEIRYYIEMNIGKKLKVADIARHFGYHPNYLIRRFTDQFGLSPKQYIQRTKLLKADKMLRESKDSITLIAHSLGFSDEPSFSRAFKSFFGCSPVSRRKKEDPAASSNSI